MDCGGRVVESREWLSTFLLWRDGGDLMKGNREEL